MSTYVHSTNRAVWVGAKAREAARCEWCEAFRAMPGEDLCVECLRQWVRQLPELEKAPEVRPADLEAEEFVRAIRTVGGSY